MSTACDKMKTGCRTNNNTPIYAISGPAFDISFHTDAQKARQHNRPSKLTTLQKAARNTPFPHDDYTERGKNSYTRYSGETCNGGYQPQKHVEAENRKSAETRTTVLTCLRTY